MKLKKYILEIFFIFFIIACTVMVLLIYIYDFYIISILKICSIAIIILFLSFLIISNRLINKLFNPINKMVCDIENIDCKYKKDDFFVHKTNIYEFDFIVKKLADMAINVSKMIKYVDDISERSGIIMGLIEIDYDSKIVTGSIRLARFFNIDFDYKNSEVIKISIDKFKIIKDKILRKCELESESVYCFERSGNKIWFNVSIDKKTSQTILFIIDVSNETIKKNQLDYERKFDWLTGLYTRDTFIEEVNRILTKNKIDIGCFITAELNNLKIINNTYGYKIGDEYIKTAAQIITELSDFSVIGKKSGFEFLIFVYGFKTKDEIDGRIQNWIEKLNKMDFVAPDERKYKIKITAGYCHFPEDASTVDNMMRYSAYALYEAKTLYKWTVHSFSLEEYNREAFIQSKVSSLDKLIDENNFEYYFQPIINLQDGSIFGYEALMRVDYNLFSSPKEVLEIASSENKLYLIEKATVFNCLNIVNNHMDVFKNKKLFYNTIASQLLNNDDSKLALKRFEEIGHILVCEISGGDYDNNEKMVEKKCIELKNRFNKVAIDNFGTKFRNIDSLYELNPNYVKFDSSLIIDINIKKEKQVFLSKLIRYAKENSILTIAVGIENKHELETVMKMGIDFAQGYYLAYPKPYFLDNISSEVKREILETRMLI